MAHKIRKCVCSPACTVAMAGGKKHATKETLLVAAFASRHKMPTVTAAAHIRDAVTALTGSNPPHSVEELAAKMSVSSQFAADILDALIAFGYLK